MALLSNVVVEVEKNEQKYSFHMPPNRPLQEAYDAAQAVCAEIIEFSKQQDEYRKKEEEANKEEGTNDVSKEQS